MIQFAWPWAVAAVLLPLLAAALPRARPPPSDALRIPFLHALRALPGQDERPRNRWALLFAVVAWLALTAAAARPQWVGDPVELPLTGRDLMLAVDLSSSMSEQDLSLDGGYLSRLAAVKHVAGDFIERRIGDRLGLIVFGTKPYVQVPLTFDRGIVRALLDETVIGLAGSATALGDAIGLAVKRLRERPAASRVLILLTDGASNAGVLQPMQAAQLAALHGLRVYTIGVGAAVPALAPGAVAATDDLALDEPTLQGIAESTGGRYFRARDSDELTAIYTLLDTLEPIDTDVEQLRPVTELFHLPLALAFVLGIIVTVFLGTDARSALQRTVD